MRKSKKIKIFVASPSDCQELRRATKQIFDTLNEGTSNIFEYFLWETNKKVEFLENDETYQNNIFKEFGSYCDVFIMFFWTRLGEGTKKEYEFFKNTFRSKNKKIKFVCFHYNKKMSHSDLSSHNTYYELINFIKSNESDWAPLGRVRGAIKSVDDYKKYLSSFLAGEIKEHARK